MFHLCPALLRLSSALAIGGLIAGCGAGSAIDGGPVTSLASIVEHKGTLPSQVVASKLGLSTSAPAAHVKAEFAPRPGPSVQATIATGGHLGWVRDREVEAYLNGILRQLMRGVPVKKRKIAVFVSATEVYGAHATHHGDIIINLGVLNNAVGEQEIAAIIAHEVAHYLLDHAETEAETRRILDATRVATSAAIVAGYASNLRSERTSTGRQFVFKDGTGQQAVHDMFQAARYGQYVVTMFDDVASNYRKRDHEFEADLLGTDLLVRAGYQPTGMTSMLDYALRDWEEREKLKPTLGDRFAKRLTENIQLGVTSIFLGASKDALADGLKRDMAEFGLQEIGKAYTGAHPSPKARLELTGQYIEKYHATASPTADTSQFKRIIESPRFKAVRQGYANFFKSMHFLQKQQREEALKAAQAGLGGPLKSSSAGRYVAYQALIELGRRDEAYAMLTGARDLDAAPPAFFSALAYEHAIRGKRPEAIALLDRGVARMGTADIFYPTRLRVLRLLRDDAATQQVATSCGGSAHQEIREACQRAVVSGNDQIAAGRTGHGLLEQAKQENTKGEGARTILQSITGVRLPGGLF